MPPRHPFRVLLLALLCGGCASVEPPPAPTPSAESHAARTRFREVQLRHRPTPAPTSETLLLQIPPRTEDGIQRGPAVRELTLPLPVPLTPAP
jgi:hypothetical protein